MHRTARPSSRGRLTRRCGCGGSPRRPGHLLPNRVRVEYRGGRSRVTSRHGVARAAPRSGAIRVTRAGFVERALHAPSGLSRSMLTVAMVANQLGMDGWELTEVVSQAHSIYRLSFELA